MNEALRLAAWLDANAKHMKYEEEQIQMRKAARELRSLDREIKSNLDALQSAHEMLAEMRKMLEDVSKQEAVGSGPRIPMPGLWR
jgi:predicted  nucleic acid-binding Zn-ribbon protein